MAAPILQEYSLFLRLLSMRVTTARLSSGVRVIDASDFRMWLIELSEKITRVKTLDEFFAQL